MKYLLDTLKDLRYEPGVAIFIAACFIFLFFVAFLIFLYYVIALFVG